MKTRKVHMDQETEELLQRILQKSNLDVDQAFKEGIKALAKSVPEKKSLSAYEIYQTLELGIGGEAKAYSAQAKQGIQKISAEKHRHDPS